MQAIWTDYGAIVIEAEAHESSVIPLHDDSPGAWLGNWTAATSDDAPHWDNRMSVVDFAYNKVNWLDTAYNSPYKEWPQEVQPILWPFYEIPQGCHAYTSIDPTLMPIFEKAAAWRLDHPMFFKPADIFAGSGTYYTDYDRYPDNGVVIMLECGYRKEEKSLVDGAYSKITWKYNYMNFLIPPLDKPLNDLRNSEYILEPYGQNLVTLCPTNPPSSSHSLYWINMHIYNTGNLTLYCPGISLYVES